MDILSNVMLGLEVALSPAGLLYCFIGVLLGTLIGVIPGVGPLTAISMLIPMTYHMDAASALIMLAGIWYGTAYGGAITAILLNIPGTTFHAVTCLDGYPMAQKGRGGVALFLAAIGSFAGGTIGIILMMLFAPLIAQYALKFGPSEYFALMLLGLVAASVITDGSAVKGLAMVVFGILVGTVGTDIYSGVQRFTFGSLDLTDGVGLVALAMGLFGVTEVIMSVGKIRGASVEKNSLKLRAMLPSLVEVRRIVPTIFRGAGIGSFFGTLPGTGPAIAAFIAYAVEKRSSKTPEDFGTGTAQGIVAPESANNAADQTAFIPTFALGVPGSATMALMLSVLIVHGVTPGPAFMGDHPRLFWGLVMSFWVGNLFLLILNIPLISVWVRFLSMPYTLLFPAVLTFVCVGAYSVSNSSFDIWLVVSFAAIGYFMRLTGLPAAPLLLGFVLGPLMEEHFRRAMLISGGDFMTFIDRPISGTVTAITAILLLWNIFSSIRGRVRARI